jgi:hypothetical protein
MCTQTKDPFLETVLNLSHFHREHEKHHAWAPLEEALALQRASRTLKALADRWSEADVEPPRSLSPFAGAEDLNDGRATEVSGVLFMEGDGEPAELRRMKAELAAAADAFEDTGHWLTAAMEQGWAMAEGLIGYPQLADVLGERHRIIANDRQNAGVLLLCADLVRRALKILEAVDFSPAALREDLAGDRRAAAYLYSASELLDRAADLIAESAVLVHENERRWRVFHARVAASV